MSSTNFPASNNEYFSPRTKVYFCIKNCLKLTPKGDNYYILTSFMWANPSIQASNKPGAYFFFLHTLEINYALYVINDNGRTKEEKNIYSECGVYFSPECKRNTFKSTRCSTITVIPSQWYMHYKPAFILLQTAQVRFCLFVYKALVKLFYLL